MEVKLDIDFDCQIEHLLHWQEVFNLLSSGQKGWQLQDAIDPIDKVAADNLDEMWESLSHGAESFEVFEATITDTRCHLQLMTGSMVVETLEREFVAWLKQCPVARIKSSLSSDDDD